MHKIYQSTRKSWRVKKLSQAKVVCMCFTTWTSESSQCFPLDFWSCWDALPQTQSVLHVLRGREGNLILKWILIASTYSGVFVTAFGRIWSRPALCARGGRNFFIPLNPPSLWRVWEKKTLALSTQNTHKTHKQMGVVLKAVVRTSQTHIKTCTLAALLSFVTPRHTPQSIGIYLAPRGPREKKQHINTKKCQAAS